ncbi:alpha/beta hydrolase [Nocardia sp. NPDC051030]|uniref:alpha/beta hydrolase n=1 Tax=Nocardia sp. NPDC051030 TaxID=3155162 RepID=UPI00343FF03F
MTNRQDRARRVGSTRLPILVAVLLLTSGCGILFGTSTSALDRYYHQHVSWGSCDGFAGSEGLSAAGIQCTRITVPLDYDKPKDGTAQIAVSRLAARGERVGSLLTNPGGPGAPGLKLPLGLSKSALAQRFDLIGIDVRGVGASTPKVECRTAADFAAERTDADLDRSTAGIAATEQRHRDLVAKCLQRTGTDVLADIGTRQAAWDMDVIRSVLGDSKLTFLGWSYGTRLGSTFAEMFPNRVRAMVLDGALDADADVLDDVGIAAGMQHAFDAYAADCVQSADCPLGTDAGQATEALRSLLNPLEDHHAATADGRGLGYLDAFSAVVNSLYSPSGWPAITKGLTEVRRGNGDTFLALADRFTTGVVNRDQQKAVLCLEETRVTDHAEALALDRRAQAVAPMMDDGHNGAQVALNVCAFWPLAPAWLPHRPSTPGLPKVVVVGTTGDPVAPYAGALALAHELGAAMISYQGVQHGVVATGVPCVDDPVTRYLVDLTPPADDLRCEAQ